MEIIEKIFANKKIESLEDIFDEVSICHDKPESRCVCENCYEYEIIIDLIKHKKLKKEE